MLRSVLSVDAIPAVVTFFAGLVPGAGFALGVTDLDDAADLVDWEPRLAGVDFLARAPRVS